MMFFVAIFIFIATAEARTLLEEAFAYGTVQFATYPLEILALVAMGSMFCTYLWMNLFVIRRLQQAKPAQDPCSHVEDPPISTRTRTTRTRSTPKDVGILAMDVYFPSTFIKQSDLEEANGVSAGKYTKGLGQEGMAFVSDREDINSIALTVVQSFMDKYNIRYDDIGRLEVGTESLVDKSKSTKTVLMDLFAQCGNTDLEGITTINACYGGTAALFNSVAWVESSEWNGKYALVVAADIAVYENGPARPSGGCGAVAMLIGPNAPLAMEPQVRTTHSSNVWDFYKPDPKSEYPTVDGAHSQECYLRALDDCYKRYCERNEALGNTKNGRVFDLETSDFMVFHSPYNKLVQKSYARLLFNDFYRNPEHPKYAELQKWQNIPVGETYSDRELDLMLRKQTSLLYKKMVEPSCRLSKQIGNCYTASVYVNIACLVDAVRSELYDKKVTVFSYGSGCMASMFCLRARHQSPPVFNMLESNAVRDHMSFSIERMAQCLDLQPRLASREVCTPKEFTNHMQRRADIHGEADWIPLGSVESLFPGTFYLENVSKLYKRSYARMEGRRVLGKSTLPYIPKINTSNEVELVSESPQMKIAVTGVSAGLPGPGRLVFDPKNLDRLLAGENCISHVSEDQKHAMLEKNIVQLQKNRSADGKSSSTTRLPVDTLDSCVKLAATLGELDLVEQYGIPKSLASCMDQSSQIAVAAGLEALKQAELVKGKIENGWGHWRLPDALRDSTGIIFATSFPALDAGVSEVTRYFQENAADDVSYEFDRKFLFRVLVLANAQLAQITGARGPNIQVNAACAGTTTAIAMAEDWIRSGRCQRVVVIGGDTASESNLFSWIGSGFRALGAATLASKVEEGALPFDARRSGMLLGSGAIGMVLEAESAIVAKSPTRQTPNTRGHCYLIASQCSNSAFHGAALDKAHIAHELNRFLECVEQKHGISRQAIAQHGVYFSHETFTHASPTASCAYSEIYALRSAFGSEMEHLVIANTKGFTGHPMGVSFEDIAAVVSLRSQTLPPIANYHQPDANLGRLKLSEGGCYPLRYALRFAAGFGSQLAFTLYHLKPE